MRALSPPSVAEPTSAIQIGCEPSFERRRYALVKVVRKVRQPPKFRFVAPQL